MATLPLASAQAAPCDPSFKYKRKYVPTAEIDQAIRTAYEHQRRGDRQVLRAVSKKFWVVA